MHLLAPQVVRASRLIELVLKPGQWVVLAKWAGARLRALGAQKPVVDTGLVEPMCARQPAQSLPYLEWLQADAAQHIHAALQTAECPGVAAAATASGIGRRPKPLARWQRTQRGDRLPFEEHKRAAALGRQGALRRQERLRRGLNNFARRAAAAGTPQPRVQLAPPMSQRWPGGV